ncbi:MAG TPA: hypothetical protein VGE40_12425, partial [Bacilli bacterium]
LRYTDPTGHSWTWALNTISTAYNNFNISSGDASLMIFGANAIGDKKSKEGAPAFSQLYVPFHEIAQINVAKKLYQVTGEEAQLEKRLKSNDGKKRKSYEADIVLGKQVWEVKPINGADPVPQLELYEKIGGLKRGTQLTDPITGINVFGNLNMEITFPNAGEAVYQLYLEEGGKRKDLTTAAAAAILFRELLKTLPTGKRFAPGF